MTASKKETRFKGLPFSREEVERLPRWAAVALAARCAMRVAPLFVPAPSTSPREARNQLLAFDVCTSLAALAAVRGRAGDPRVARQADDIISAGRDAFPSEYSAEYFAAKAAGLSATAPLKNAESLIGHVEQCVAAGLQSLYHYFEERKTPALFSERSAKDDFEFLLKPDLPPGAGFFARPLWKSGEITEGWGAVLRVWESQLKEHRLSEIYSRHMSMIHGKEIDWRLMERLVADWATDNMKGYSAAKHDSVEQRPVKQAVANEAVEVESAIEDQAPYYTEQDGPLGDVPPLGLMDDFVGAPSQDQPESQRGSSEAAADAQGKADAQSKSGLRNAYVSEGFGRERKKESPQRRESKTVAGPASEPQPPRERRRADLRMLSDEPTDDAGDRLDFKVYADALAGLIDNPATKTPLTISINAPWGAGKSTLAGMVRRRLEGKPAAGGEKPHVACWFNAWMHDDAANLASAFAAEVAQSADCYRGRRHRLFSPLPASMLTPAERFRQRVMIGVILLLLSFVVSELTFLLFPVPAIFEGELIGKVLKAVGPRGSIFVATVALVLLLAKILPVMSTAAKSLSEFVSDPKGAAESGAMHVVRAQLRKLIQQATPAGSRFVVFVDDLDRCQPPRSVDVLEVVNQLLNHENVVTVIMADMPALAACADIKYKEVAERYTPGYRPAAKPEEKTSTGYGRLYLQKIIQLQFDLPIHRPEKILAMVDALAKESPEAGAPTGPGPSATQRWGDRLRRAAGPIRKSWAEERTLLGLLRAAAKTEPRAVSPFLVAVWLAAAPIVGPASWIANRAYELGYPRRERAAARSRRTPVPSFVTAVVLFVVHTVVFTTMVVEVGARLVGLSLLSRAAFDGLVSMEIAALALIGLRWWNAGRRNRVRDREEADKKRQHWENRIEEMAERGETDFKRVEEALIQEEKLWSLYPGEETFLRERLQLRLMNDSELLRQAHEEVIRHLPPLPRSAKRLLNRLRLLLYIAHERRMFGGAPELTPQHMGKWAVLRERWPELANALLTQPGAMKELEAKAEARDAQFHERVKVMAPSLAGDPELEEFCRSGAQVGELLERIVYFQSAQVPAAEPQAQAAAAAS